MSTPSAAAAVEVHRSHFVSPVASSSAGKGRGGGGCRRDGDGSSGKAGAGRPPTCSPDALAALDSRRRELQEALARLREAKEAREASWHGEEEEEAEEEEEEEDEEEEEEEEEPRPRTVVPPTPIRV